MSSELKKVSLTNDFVIVSFSGNDGFFDKYIFTKSASLGFPQVKVGFWGLPELPGRGFNMSNRSNLLVNKSQLIVLETVSPLLEIPKIIGS